jgi:hypothetical protein
MLPLRLGLTVVIALLTRSGPAGILGRTHHQLLGNSAAG